MELKLVQRQRTGEDDRVRIVPPQPAVLPVPAQVLAGDLRQGRPFSTDVARASRAVDEAERWPDGVIASQDERVPGASQNGFHTAAVSLNARSGAVPQAGAVHGPPKIRVEFEIRAAPLAAHDAKRIFEMLLNGRIGPIEGIPRATTPPLKGH